MYASPSGDLTAPVWAADIDLDPATAASNTSGCQAADYAGMPPGAIVLLQDGTSCSLGTKFFGAQQLGAGAIFFFDAAGGTWINVDGIAIPSVAGEPELRDRAGQRRREGRDRPHRAPEGRLAAGHLPDVERDRRDPRRRSRTASSSSARTSTASASARASTTTAPARRRSSRSRSRSRKVKPRNKIRFIWFGAEEHGLLGLAGLRRQPAAVRARQDRGDAELRHGRLAELRALRLRRRPVGLRAARGRGAAGSADIEQLFLDYFASQGLATEPTAFDGRSDYGPFIFAGIPAGGLFTGAEGIKTAEEAAIYGGTAGAPYDPCYHLGCDTIDNLNDVALDQMSDAAAHATITLAQTKRLFPSTATAVKTGSGAGPTGGHSHVGAPSRGL